MDIGLNIDPTAFFDTRSDRRSENQRQLDNAFRREQADLAEEWNWRQWNDRDKKISQTVQDARRAGVGPLAALGAGGSQAMSITIPQGQGGRVQGRRQNSVSVSQNKAETRTHYQNLIEEAQLDNLKTTRELNNYKAARERLQYANERLDWEKRLDGQEDLPKLYKKALDNSQEASRWVRDGYFPFTNPDFNLETPESVGGYYFAKPRIEGNTVEKIKEWE